MKKKMTTTDLIPDAFGLLDVVLKIFEGLSMEKIKEIKENRISVETVKELMALCRVGSERNRSAATTRFGSDNRQSYVYLRNEEPWKESQSRMLHQEKKNMDPADLTCTYCGKGSHTFKYCYKRLQRCYKCGSKEHFIAECNKMATKETTTEKVNIEKSENSQRKNISEDVKIQKLTPETARQKETLKITNLPEKLNSIEENDKKITENLKSVEDENMKHEKKTKNDNTPKEKKKVRFKSNPFCVWVHYAKDKTGYHRAEIDTLLEESAVSGTLFDQYRDEYVKETEGINITWNENRQSITMPLSFQQNETRYNVEIVRKDGYPDNMVVFGRRFADSLGNMKFSKIEQFIFKRAVGKEHLNMLESEHNDEASSFPKEGGVGVD